MIFRYKIFDYDLLSKNPFSLLVIENEATYFKFFSDLDMAIDGSGDNFVLVRNGKGIKLNTYFEWIINNWLLDLKERKLITAMHKNLEKNFMETAEVQEILRLWCELEDLLAEFLFTETGAEVPDNIFGVADILKIFKVGFSDLSRENYIERLEDYLLIKADYMKKRVFLFENLTAYLTNDEICEIYDFCLREEICIINVEASFTDKIKKSPGRLILVDRDNCDLLLRES